ncbi:hypothetical protein E8D34_03665 [Nocardioides sp. GY 10113]|uniref:hypothetical protein n=1 Tax=Nocardioides sp. GY 10113 TaxID=2569761 RepID=UPI0010A90B0E|nr:hypothetical protein [Nocardioides sp. GY 10113]TIC88772.1 hypothetical protein E8D34_03665 [Nocardioides sp. GY 10113]
MMTTAAPLRSAALAVLASGGVLVVVAASLGGSAAASGALVGTLVAVAVFGLGAAAVQLVARVMPAASLLFAMVTYTFQVVVMALFFVALNRSGLLEGTLDRGWLGGAIIVGVLVWTSVHLVAAANARIPAFEQVPEGMVRRDQANVEGGGK